MRSVRTFMAVLAALVIVSVAQLPLRVAAHPAVQFRGRIEPGKPVFTFGVRGGNIRPFTVMIYSNGDVAPTTIAVRDRHLAFAADTVHALKKLLVAEGFFSLPQTNQCPGTLPDIGTRYVALLTAARSHAVSFHGACSASFDQVWAALYAAADVAF